MATRQEYLPSKEDFKKFVEMDKKNLYTVFDHRFREEAGLDEATFWSIVLHHSELSEMYPDVVEEPEEEI